MAINLANASRQPYFWANARHFIIHCIVFYAATKVLNFY